MHFGAFDVVPNNKQKFLNLVLDAAINADFVGFPDDDALRRNYEKCLAKIDVRACLGLYYAKLCANFVRVDRRVNWWISRSMLSHYEEIINNYKKLCLVTNHKGLNDFACNRFNLDQCDIVLIPDQAKNNEDKQSNTSFYPSAYLKILSDLPREEGGLYLVGAGLLGKPICNYIKGFKGHAIDVGSMLDIWAGVITRPGVDLSIVNKFKWTD